MHTYGVGEKLAIYSKRLEDLERESQLLREVGLVEEGCFALKMPEGGGVGRLGILVRGRERIAWLSVRGTGRRREPAGGSWSTFCEPPAPRTGTPAGG
jgi:hypothetical protein